MSMVWLFTGWQLISLMAPYGCPPCVGQVRLRFGIQRKRRLQDMIILDIIPQLGGVVTQLTGDLGGFVGECNYGIRVMNGTVKKVTRRAP